MTAGTVELETRRYLRLRELAVELVIRYPLDAKRTHKLLDAAWGKESEGIPDTAGKRTTVGTATYLKLLEMASVLDDLHPEDSQRVQGLFDEAWKSGKVQRLEAELVAMRR